MPGGGRKTWAGSAAFLIVTAAVGMAVLGVTRRVDGAGGMAAVLAAVPLTVVEGLLGRGTDNPGAARWPPPLS